MAPNDEVSGLRTALAMGAAKGVLVSDPALQGSDALTTAKVFLYDVWYLDKPIRVAAFTGLGVALFIGSFLYRRFNNQLKDWIKPQPLQPNSPRI